MSAQAFENFLAKLYVDDKVRVRFLADPRSEALRAGLAPNECDALEKIDLIGLELAAHSFARKRAALPAEKSVFRLPRWLKRR